METLRKLCVTKICRTCLCESSQMRSLSAKINGENRTLIDVLSFVTNMNITIENRYPKQVCSDCESIMCKFDAFKRRCIDSEMILNHQIDLTMECHIDQNIPTNSLIKDEHAFKIDKNDFDPPLQSSITLGKSSDSSINYFYDNLSGNDDKVKTYVEISPSEHNDIVRNESKPSAAERKVVKLLKEEENIEFDTHSVDVSFDFDDTETFEAMPNEFKQELLTVKELKVFSCSCGTVLNNHEEYKSHSCKGNKKSVKIKMETKTNINGSRSITIKKQIVCPECNTEFATIKACNRHKKNHCKKSETRSNYECTMCMRKFHRQSSFTNHMNQHDLKSNIKYTCETCKRQFQHKAHLDNHILALHTRDKGYLCDICMTNFATPESLETHKDSHKVDKKHKCKFCKKGFYMLSTLNDHLRTHTGEKPYLCSICGRGFSQKTNLAQHMRRHKGEKPFKCEECDRGFVSKGELVAHTRKHSGAHPFVCDDCGSGFTTSSSLVKHRRVHTGERPYACDLCPMRFAASGTLKNHRRTHTGEKPFQCSYCEKAFVQRQDLVSHIRGHTGERPYACGCGQAFRKASALKAHVRVHEKDPQRELTLLQPTALLLTLPAGTLPIAGVVPTAGTLPAAGPP
ncbi:zinc finger protein 34-like [Pectinophora gossypiella]|uniref:zinc finger protein 34-like n=1 Tax=Pectinophora gossypiella TaxID=13191 RepID=UPI00214DF4B6|nr:zinc finger protein 34-like [Pectinophora gossypiella]